MLRAVILVTLLLLAVPPLAAQEWTAEQQEVVEWLNTFNETAYAGTADEFLAWIHPQFTGWSFAEEAPVEIALADTIGVGVPSDVVERCSAVRAAIGPHIPLRAHFHDTRNTGLANAFAAREVGVATLDASLAGIGGCPLAPTATGNIATEDLVYMLNRMQVEHAVDLDGLLDGAQWLQETLGRPVPSMLLKAGGFP